MRRLKQMIHAYDKNYLPRAQTLMGVMFHVAIYDFNIPLEVFYDKFLFSNISSYFEAGDSSILGGRSGVEIALDIINDDTKANNIHPIFDRSPEYWCGWALAYFQWYSGLKFLEINKYISIREILNMYNPYHEMDISQFCDHMIELYNSRKPYSNLKLLRIDANLSQSELSKLSEVPVRTIQQYEQKQKNINKASAETIIKLAKVLNCSVLDLMEFDNT